MEDPGVCHEVTDRHLRLGAKGFSMFGWCCSGLRGSCQPLAQC